MARGPGRREACGGDSDGRARTKGRARSALGRWQRLRRARAASGCAELPRWRSGWGSGALPLTLRGCREGHGAWGARGTRRSGRPSRGARPAAVQHHLERVDQSGPVGGVHVPLERPCADDAEEVRERPVAHVPAALAQALDELRAGQGRGEGRVRSVPCHRADDELLELRLARGGRREVTRGGGSGRVGLGRGCERGRGESRRAGRALEWSLLQ